MKTASIATRARGAGLGALRAGLLILAFGALGATGCGGGGGDAATREGGSDAPIAPVPTGAHFMLAPDQVHYGGTYAEWSQRWWQWVYEMPRTGHPLYDLVGTDAATGQIEPVWFLGGLFTPLGVPLTGTVTRTITIPSGVALFFPIINASAENTTCVGPDTTLSFTQLRKICADAVVAVRDISCEIDGEVVVSSPNLAGARSLRAQAPAFSVYRTADSIWADACGGIAPPARSISPVASDGIWMMIAPLPAGAHSLHFTGTFPTTSFTLDVTYHITVQP